MFVDDEPDQLYSFEQVLIHFDKNIEFIGGAFWSGMFCEIGER